MKINEFKLPDTDGVWREELGSFGAYLTDEIKEIKCYVSCDNFNRFRNSLGPAFIVLRVYHNEDIQLAQRWYVNGKLHRLTVLHALNLRWVKIKIYYIEGKFYRKNEFSSAVIQHILGIETRAAKILKCEF